METQLFSTAGSSALPRPEGGSGLQVLWRGSVVTWLAIVPVVGGIAGGI